MMFNMVIFVYSEFDGLSCTLSLLDVSLEPFTWNTCMILYRSHHNEMRLIFHEIVIKSNMHVLYMEFI